MKHVELPDRTPACPPPGSRPASAAMASPLTSQLPSRRPSSTPVAEQSSASTSANDQPDSTSRRSSRALPAPTREPQTIVLPLSRPHDGEEPGRCWICLQDEPEDPKELAEWRSPCPCILIAHEECILAWIQDLESQGHRGKYLCPQCKAEIHLVRPFDPVVWTTDFVLHISRFMIAPTVIIAATSCLYSGLFTYGANAVKLVFGPEEARLLLASSASDEGWYEMVGESILERVGSILGRGLKSWNPFFPYDDASSSLAVFIGLPMVSPALIASRVTLLDSVFAFVPIPYFLFSSGSRNGRYWPPTPCLTLAMLPYLRSAYNQLYRYTFHDMEQKWERAVKVQTPNALEGAAILDIQLDLDDFMVDGNGQAQGWPNWMGQPVDQRPNPQQPGQPAPNADFPGEGIDAGEHDGDRGPDEGQPRQVLRQSMDTTRLASTVIGALLFPGISSFMGDVLKHVLPSRIVSRSSATPGNFASGLLQEKWGRSIVGGCLFVVLKDALVLYCKWRKAKNVGKRHILDYRGVRRTTGGSPLGTPSPGSRGWSSYF